jgi:hypothetical protein
MLATYQHSFKSACALRTVPLLRCTGTKQGYQFDLSAPPPRAVPLTDSLGWAYAAELLAQLLEYGDPASQAEAPLLGGLGVANLAGPNSFSVKASLSKAAAACPVVSPTFQQGACLATFEYDAILANLADSPALRAPNGRLHIAPLPGSAVVWDRGTNTLQRCGGNASANSTLLPFDGVPSGVLCGLSALHDARFLPGGAAAAGMGAASNVTAGPRATWLNRAPYSTVLDVAGKPSIGLAGDAVMVRARFWVQLGTGRLAHTA